MNPFPNQMKLRYHLKTKVYNNSNLVTVESPLWHHAQTMLYNDNHGNLYALITHTKVTI
jgi:hypothetical protein